MQASLTTPQRLLWEIDANLQDGFGILNDLQGPLVLEKPTLDDWNEVVSVLSQRLNEMPKRVSGDDNEFFSNYHRQKVMNWLLHALEAANRNHEVIGVLECETAYTNCYVELVKRLIQDNQIEKAREWAYKGFGATLEKLPGIAAQLQELLRDIALGEKNYLLAAAYCAFEFFKRPSVQKYSQLEDVATKADVWVTVREKILLYLEKGETTDLENNTKAIAAAAWPLPSLPLSVPSLSSIRHHFPDTETLIDIAIKEKRHDDVIKWHHLSRKSNRYGMAANTGSKVAQAIQETHPDEAITVWKALAAEEISRAKPAAHKVAGQYLREIHTVYRRINNQAAWAQYMLELREENVSVQRSHLFFQPDKAHTLDSQPRSQHVTIIKPNLTRATAQSRN